MRPPSAPSRRPVSVGLSLLLVVSLVAFGAAVGPAAAADARVALTDTAVTPATPTVGAPITAETTLRLSGGSDTSITVDEVRVVDPGGTDESTVLGTATDLGRLSPGETLDVPVTFTVNESGTYDLRLVAVGTDSDGERARATRPLTIGVEPGGPQVDIDTDTLVAGAESPVRATVSNPTNAPLRGVEVAVDGGSKTTIATLAAGATQTVNLSARLPEAGERSLELTTSYRTPNGAQSRTETSKSVTVEPLATDIGLRVERAQSDDSQQGAGDLTGLLGGGGTDALQSQSGGQGEASASRVDVTVTNFGNAPADEVVLVTEDGEGAQLSSVGRFAVADTLGPGESTTVTVDLSTVSTDDVRFVAGYETPSGDDESALVYGYDAQRGAAALTGIDVSVTDGGRVTVDGNLANVGDGELTSAVVTVQPTDGVQPAYPQRDYFVGTVDASAFAPFELTAQADTDNATEVPIQVTYTVDGEQRTETVNAPLPPAEERSGGGPLSGGVAVGLVVALLALAGGTVYVTRYRNQ